MQLLILIIPDNGKMEQILVKMMEAGIRGGSLVDCEGALQAVGQSKLHKPPVFSSLEQYLKPDTGKGENAACRHGRGADRNYTTAS